MEKFPGSGRSNEVPNDATQNWQNMEQGAERASTHEFLVHDVKEKFNNNPTLKEYARKAMNYALIAIAAAALGFATRTYKAETHDVPPLNITINNNIENSKPSAEAPIEGDFWSTDNDLVNDALSRLGQNKTPSQSSENSAMNPQNRPDTPVTPETPVPPMENSDPQDSTEVAEEAASKAAEKEAARMAEEAAREAAERAAEQKEAEARAAARKEAAEKAAKEAADELARKAAEEAALNERPSVGTPPVKPSVGLPPLERPSTGTPVAVDEATRQQEMATQQEGSGISQYETLPNYDYGETPETSDLVYRPEEDGYPSVEPLGNIQDALAREDFGLAAEDDSIQRADIEAAERADAEKIANDLGAPLPDPRDVGGPLPEPEYMEEQVTGMPLSPSEYMKEQVTGMPLPPPEGLKEQVTGMPLPNPNDAGGPSPDGGDGYLEVN